MMTSGLVVFVVVLSLAVLAWCCGWEAAVGGLLAGGAVSLVAARAEHVMIVGGVDQRWRKRIRKEGGEMSPDGKIAAVTVEGKKYEIVLGDHWPFKSPQRINGYPFQLRPWHGASTLNDYIAGAKAAGIPVDQPQEHKKYLVYCHQKNPFGKEVPHFMADEFRELAGRQFMDAYTVDIGSAIFVEGNDPWTHFQCDGFSKDFFSEHEGEYDMIFAMDCGGKWWRARDPPKGLNDKEMAEFHEDKDNAPTVESIFEIVMGMTSMLKPGGALYIGKLFTLLPKKEREPLIDELNVRVRSVGYSFDKIPKAHYNVPAWRIASDATL